MIHFHGTSGGFDLRCYDALEGRALLWSFADGRERLEHVRRVSSLYCIDSGAFTFWRSGQAHDLKGYAELMEEVQHDPHLVFVVGPDIIDGGWERNGIQQGCWFYDTARLPKRLCCPVWHTSEEPAALKHLAYLSQVYDRVGIGSSGHHQLKSLAWWRVMQKAWEVLAPGGRARCFVHGFRMLDPEIIEAFPWSSCDSTMASRNIRDGSRDRFGQFPRASKRTRLAMICEHIETFRPPFRFDPQRAVQGGLFERPDGAEATNEERQAARGA
jgi:hypothetical protein